jgi:hypothetical protein
LKNSESVIEIEEGRNIKVWDKRVAWEKGGGKKYLKLLYGC